MHLLVLDFKVVQYVNKDYALKVDYEALIREDKTKLG